MINNQIFVLNFCKEDEAKFSKVLNELNLNANFSQDMKDSSNPSMIFLNANEDAKIFSNELTSLRNKYTKVPLVIVLNDGEFDKLLTAYQLNVEHVIVRSLEQVDIEQAITKVSLISDDDLNEKVPVKQLLKLFSSPMKINDDETLFKYLQEYFSQFEQTNLGLYSFSKEFQKIAGNNEVKQELLELKLKEYIHIENSVGQIFQTLIDGLDVVIIPIYHDDQFKTFAVLEIEPSKCEEIVNDYLINFILGIFHYRRNKEKALSLKELSNTDEVTGLYNQRKLFSDLNEIISIDNPQHTFSLLFIDIDHFKNVNDKFGHICGGHILVQIGSLIRSMLRDSDLVYRYGGDEFVVLLPKIVRNRVHDIAIRILEKIKKHQFKVSNEETYQLTVSIGICEYPKDATSAKEIINFADQMMYQSKSSGRGKVFHLKEVLPRLISVDQV